MSGFMDGLYNGVQSLGSAVYNGMQQGGKSAMGFLSNNMTMDKAFGGAGSKGGGWFDKGAAALGDLGQLYGGIQQVNQGKKQMTMQRNAFNQNAMMQAQDFNNQKRELFGAKFRGINGREPTQEEVGAYMAGQGNTRSVQEI